VLKDPVPGSAKPIRKLAFPAWSPDGAQLAFQYEDGLGVVNLDGTGARPLLSNRGDHTFTEPEWSPDGKTLAFGAVNVEDGISVVDITTGQERRVTQDCSIEPSWSPDGRKIACWSFSVKGSAIHAVDFATGAVQRLTKRTRVGRASYAPSWSPDGLRIVFGKFKRIGATIGKSRSDVYVMNSDGTRQHRVIRDGFIPDWGRQP
jgi:Tol biopolymer transport system component